MEHTVKYVELQRYPQSERPPWEFGAVQAAVNCVSYLPWLTALTQQEILRLVGVDVPLCGLSLQQDPSIYALCHTSQEE